ncbi:subtilase family protein [Halanaerobium saccharolyticum]|uniref:Subtilase family protein n=1 Tax=Halanaerobium saccharolyticum TaxID=43595 RepID=A0A4R6LNZ0_9FIRM|nr:S8/S53 family peptidase [Halanaerobium saccharolyticum]TDO85881.1 subtilase family protein [Halanaerobium saccharolyticum]
MKNDSVKIFIIDSKIDKDFLNSPALKIQPESSHGSKIAAVIRSQSRVKIKTLSAENLTGRIDENNYLAALREIKNYAVLHPEQKIVVNISLGFEESGFQRKIIKKINELQNIVLVAAAGNNNQEKISYPAKFENVIAAAALEGKGKMPGSNYGQEIDFAASGIIKITQRYYLPAFNFSRKYKLTGTSFAAPQVTALIADVLSLNPELSIKETLKIITATADKIADPLFSKNKLGAGRIDRFEALSKARPLYFWLQLAVYSSLMLAALFLLYFCWQKYSISGIFIFLIVSATIFLIQPILLLFYYQFGLLNIMLFLLSLGAIYVVSLKLLKFYLKNSSNFSLMLKIGPHLNNKLQDQVGEKITRFLTENNINKQKLEQAIISSLRQSYSQKKIEFYLQLAAAFKLPPIALIIEKTMNSKISAGAAASKLNLEQKNKKEQFILIAELLAVIFNNDYSEKKKAAEIAAALNSALILIPIKNTLQKRNQLQLNDSVLFFLLDIVGGFAEMAADFTPLLKEIITQASNPWLKFHALQAYQTVGIGDSDYQEFINKIKAKEKEPVLLALK